MTFVLFFSPLSFTDHFQTFSFVFTIFDARRTPATEASFKALSDSNKNMVKSLSIFITKLDIHTLESLQEEVESRLKEMTDSPMS